MSMTSPVNDTGCNFVKAASVVLISVAVLAAAVAAAAAAVLFVPALFTMVGLPTMILYIGIGGSAALAVISGLGAAILNCFKSSTPTLQSDIPALNPSKNASQAPLPPPRDSEPVQQTTAKTPPSPPLRAMALTSSIVETSPGQVSLYACVELNSHRYALLNPNKFEECVTDSAELVKVIPRNSTFISFGRQQVTVKRDDIKTPHFPFYSEENQLIYLAAAIAEAILDKHPVFIAADHYARIILLLAISELMLPYYGKNANQLKTKNPELKEDALQEKLKNLIAQVEGILNKQLSPEALNRLWNQVFNPLHKYIITPPRSLE